MSSVVRIIAVSFIAVYSFALIGCGQQKVTPTNVISTQTLSLPTRLRSFSSTGSNISRPGFLGAFFRPQGEPPFGIFASEGNAPVPYPTPGSQLHGFNSYCDGQDSAGNSIDSAYPINLTKLNDIIFLGARWMRMPVSQFFIDNSHVFGAGQYAFATVDAAQCIALGINSLKPVIGLEAGPVNYNATPGTFSPQINPRYQSAADFGQWCGVVAAHEKAVFPSVTQFSLPGNEVNTNPALFPGGNPQIAAYSMACYAAIKAANPNTYVYGFELNMDGSLNAPGFVQQMFALGCKVGTCYDGIAIHLTLRYPIPPSGTPCYPHSGGDYSMQCVTDIESAAQAPIHVLISESVYPVPGMVPDEYTKGEAIVAEMTAFASDSTIDGVSYANVDECPLYSGFFSDGCLIDPSGNILTGYSMLQWYASNNLL